MEVTELKENKKQYMDLLLLADEQESMIDRYINRGRVFVLKDPQPRAQCVITQEAEGIYEIKNLAVYPRYQRLGYGRQMIEKMLEYFHDWKEIYVGTGETPATLLFYESCGFKVCGRIKNFFTQHYNHPIYDGGVLLADMIYLKREK